MHVPPHDFQNGVINLWTHSFMQNQALIVLAMLVVIAETRWHLLYLCNVVALEASAMPTVLATTPTATVLCLPSILLVVLASRNTLGDIDRENDMGIKIGEGVPQNVEGGVQVGRGAVPCHEDESEESEHQIDLRDFVVLILLLHLQHTDH